MRYLSAPVWDDERCANTDSRAVPLDVEVVRGRRAIHVVNATYRRAVFNGTFLLSDSVALPLPKEGKRRVMVECCWYGHRLIEDEPLFLIDLGTAVVYEYYDGPVTANLGQQRVN
jgi:hypothetical protein